MIESYIKKKLQNQKKKKKKSIKLKNAKIITKNTLMMNFGKIKSRSTTQLFNKLKSSKLVSFILKFHNKFPPLDSINGQKTCRKTKPKRMEKNRK